MVVRAMPYKVTGCGLSDIGLVRQNNEDYWHLLPDLNFFVLADGMGGHRAGEVASEEAVKALCQIIEKAIGSEDTELSIEETNGILQFAIEHVNDVVYQKGQSDEDLRGMGTTICCLLFHPQGLVYGYVGDSRIYRFRNKKLEQLSVDHSLLRELVDLGQMNSESSADLLYKNILTRAIGTESSVESSVHTTEVMDQDIYLMCTDGLSDVVTRKEMERILTTQPSIEKATKKLVETAKDRGGYDNITVVLAKVEYD